MSNNAFLPEDYVAPSAGGFTKLNTGDNTMRILSSPLMMWVIWEGGACSRVPYGSTKPAKGSGEKDSVKHGWGLIVWNYDTKSLEVFELDKQDILSGLTAYSKNPKWGHPKQYDIVINKTGAGMETTYKLVVEPKEPLCAEAKLAYTENPVDLNKLLSGENPFLPKNGEPAAATPAAQKSKIVTPDNWVKGDAAPAGFEVVNDALQPVADDDLPF